MTSKKTSDLTYDEAVTIVAKQYIFERLYMADTNWENINDTAIRRGLFSKEAIGDISDRIDALTNNDDIDRLNEAWSVIETHHEDKEEW